MLIRILTALLYMTQERRRAQAVVRDVNLLRRLAGGRVYHYPGEAAAVRRINKLERDL